MREILPYFLMLLGVYIFLRPSGAISTELIGILIFASGLVYFLLFMVKNKTNK